MATRSFSLLLCNLFVGLTKGARGLGQYATHFKQLGYRIFRLEPVFRLDKGGKCNPDVVLSSPRRKHTLIVEWTNPTSVHDDKKDQLCRYSRVVRNDLVNTLAIPPKEADTFDILVIVSQRATDSFAKCLTENKYAFVLFTFLPGDDISTLQKVVGTIGDVDTDAVLSHPMSLRIPVRYIPFALDNPSAGELVTHIVAHLVSLMARGAKAFDIDGFCAGFVSVWSVIALEKRRDISAKTKEILTRLSRKPIGEELLSRKQRANPPAWQLLKSPISQTNARALRSRLQDFISEVKGTQWQMELPFDEAPPEETRRIDT